VSVKIETTIDTSRGNDSSIPTPVIPTAVTRRGFVQMGGALFVSLALPAGFSACKKAVSTAGGGNQPDPSLLHRGLRFAATIRFWHGRPC